MHYGRYIRSVGQCVPPAPVIVPANTSSPCSTLSPASSACPISNSIENSDEPNPAGSSGAPIAPSSQKPTDEANRCNLRHVTPKTRQKALYVVFSQIGRPLQVVWFGWTQFLIPKARPAG